ncbi:MAG: AAA family ATPase, partial [Elusimicrobiota bacterium]
MIRTRAIARVVSASVASALILTAPGLPAYAAGAAVVRPLPPISAASSAVPVFSAAPLPAASASFLGMPSALAFAAAPSAAAPSPAPANALSAVPAIAAAAAADSERPSALSSVRAAAAPATDAERPSRSMAVFDGALSAAADGPEIESPRPPSSRTRVSFTLALDPAKGETVAAALSRLHLYYGFSAEAVPEAKDGKAAVTGSVPLSTVLPLARARGVLGLQALPGDPAPEPSSLGASAARLVKAAVPAEKREPFVAATRRVADLELLAKQDPPKAQAQAIAYLEGRREKRREVRIAALDVLAARPLADVLPYYKKTLTLFAEPRVQEAKAGGSDAVWYIQRAILQRLARESETVKADAPLAAALKTAYKDRNGSVRLAAAAALRAAGVEPGPENEYRTAPKTGYLARTPSSDPDGIPGVDETIRAPAASAVKTAAKPAPRSFWRRWKYALIGAVIAASIALGAMHYRSASGPKTPAAIAASVAPEKDPTDKEILRQIANAQERIAGSQERIARSLEAQAAAQKAAQRSGLLSSIGMMLLSSLIFIGLFAFLPKIMKKLGGAMNGTGDAEPKAKGFVDKPTQRFSDIEGIDESLVDVQETLDFLSDPSRFDRMGVTAPKGILFEGPPGTGKTLMARALAGETNSAFFAVSGSDFVELFVGMGARRVRELITTAAGHKPAIVFIDEIDAVGKARGIGGNGADSEREQTINALLTGMDGFDNSGGIIFVAATNRADTLDPALLRPGRFDRKIYVGKPHMGGREAIATIHATNKRLAPDLDLGYLARRTSGLAGADIKNIMNEAGLQALRRGADAIGMEDVDEAIDRGTIGAKRSLPMPDKLKERIAYHEAGHVLANMLNENVEVRQKVTKFTIVPHGSGALGFAEMGAEEGDKYLYTLEELEAKIDHALGGLVAEKLVYGKTQEVPEEFATNRRAEWSTGPGSDLEVATNVARTMVQ